MKSKAKSYFGGNNSGGAGSGGYNKVKIKVGTAQPKSAGIPTDSSASLAMGNSYKRAGARVKTGNAKTWC